MSMFQGQRVTTLGDCTARRVAARPAARLVARLLIVFASATIASIEVVNLGDINLGSGARAQGIELCGEAAFARVVDDTAEMLRKQAQLVEPFILGEIERLTAPPSNLGRPEAEGRIESRLKSADIERLDARIGRNLEEFDTASDPQGQGASCERLERLRTLAAALERDTASKAQLMLAALRTPVEQARPGGTGRAGEREQNSASLPHSAAPVERQGRSAQPAEVAPSSDRASDDRVARVPPLPQPQAAGPSWTTETVERPQDSVVGDAQLPRERPVLSREDLRLAGKGVFGTFSAELAAAIDYAISTYGRPDGFIVGSEGGGALIAGVRYGGGTLTLATGEQRPIYWQGPSIGYDFGLSGSQVMFLVYNATSGEGVRGRFPGVEGAAYIVGGVGLTVMRRGDVTVVPIRTGLGLRVTANIGYLNFSTRQRFNPF